MISRERLLHLCFDEEDFKHDNFHAAKFLVDKRRHVTIDILQKDLRAYSEHLKEEVVQLINTDLYDNFLSVSNKLFGIDVELARICEPLPEMINKVDRASKKLEDSRSVVKQKLVECQAVDANRQYYMQLLKIGIMKDKISDWLDGCMDQVTEGSDLDALRRMAIECKQLEIDETLCIPTNNDQEDERQGIVERTVQLRTKYHELLNDQFVYVLRRQQELLMEDDKTSAEMEALKQRMLSYLECYTILEREGQAATLFREQVCKEVVDKVLSWTVTGNQRNAPPDALAPLFTELLKEIEAKCIPMVKIANEVSTNFRLIKSIWKCVMDVIIKRMQNIFSPGIQSKFHTHYMAAHNLLIGLESHVSSAEELQDFRASEEMELWNSKWLLSVYVALRQKEVMTGLTASMQSTLQRQSDDMIASTGYSFVQVQTIHKLLFWLWGDTVCLYPLADQFMKMTIRTISVLDRWFSQYWTAAEPEPEPAPAEAPATVDAEGNPVAPVAVKPEPRNGLFASELKLKDFVELYCDLLKLRTVLEADFPAVVLKVMHQDPSAGTSTLSAIRDVCKHCCEVGSTQLLVAKQRIVQSVAKECTDTLASPLKSITSLYRMTKKPVPTRFSFFIPTVLGPLQNFVTACSGGGPNGAPTYPLPKTTLEEVIVDCLAAVTNAYHDEAKALLITAKKAEKAVSTLRKKQKKTADGKPVAEEAEKEMSDTDKIYVQIHLDILEYGNQMKILFGVTATDFDPYLHLQALVIRAKWLLGEISEEPVDTLE